jgi:DNA-binding SARP family transcriptional activator
LVTENGTWIQLCGRLVVRLKGVRREDELPGRQGRLLFAYLAVNRSRPMGRHELVEALWPAGGPATAESSLSSLLSKLRRVLGHTLIPGRAEIELVLPADAWIDLEAAPEGLHRAESAIARSDWAGAWGPSHVALHIAARGFLPGFEEPWVEEQRRELEDIRVRALECLAASGLGLGEADLAATDRSARALIKAAPLRESGYRFLMQAHAERGNVAEALVVYDGLRVRLREELGTGPSAVTRELHRELLAGSSRT